MQRTRFFRKIPVAPHVLFDEAMKYAAATAVLIAAFACVLPAVAEPPATRPAVDARAVETAASRGLDYLVAHQLPSGGWGQGEVSDAMRQRMAHDPTLMTEANVADTSVAVLALIRGGRGDSEVARRGIAWVCNQVEASPADSPRVTDRQGTCAQRKLGDLVDTFAAAWMLSEAVPTMSQGPDRDRAAAALRTAIGKMEQSQGDDGRWQQAGWATALSQGVAAKAFNQAPAAGVAVNDEARRKANAFGGAMVAADGEVAPAAMRAGAGIELYARASNLQQLADADAENRRREDALRGAAADPATRPADREAAEAELKEIAATRERLQQAQAENVARLDDDAFVAGFGSDGGEEYLSYLHLAEGLAAGEDAAAFGQFRRRVLPSLVGVQGDDGSWTGHHCITGKTFCTAAAVMTLCADQE